MGRIANLILRVLGLGSAVDALNGQTSKAYLGGLGLMLSGGATLLGGLANLALEAQKITDLGGWIAFAKHMTNDPNAALVLAGAALISKGLADIGQRHALAKAVTASGLSALPAPTP